MTSKDNIREFLHDEGYGDFHVDCINDFRIKGKRIIPKNILKKLKTDLGFRVDECTIIYNDYPDKKDIEKVEYRLNNPLYEEFNQDIDSWLRKHNLFIDFSIIYSSIIFYDYSDTFKDYIREFEDDFDVVLDFCELSYKNSSEGCDRKSIFYEFKMKNSPFA